MRGDSSAMSGQSECGFNFLALWGGAESEDGGGSGGGGGQGSDRGEQKAAGLGEVHASTNGHADPGKRIAVSCLMPGFRFAVFLVLVFGCCCGALVNVCTRRSVNELSGERY